MKTKDSCQNKKKMLRKWCDWKGKLWKKIEQWQKKKEKKENSKETVTGGIWGIYIYICGLW